MAEISEGLHEELAIDKGWLEQIEVGGRFTVICNREGGSHGLAAEPRFMMSRAT